MNGFYTRFQNRRLTNAGALASATLRMLLLRSTGSYSFNPDHDYVADLFSNGGVEITVASYARQTLGSLVTTLDDTNNRNLFDAANPSFGSLETGQTVSALVIYEFVTNDAASPLVCHIDGKIRVTAAAPAAAGATGNITGITQANPAVVTSNSHGRSNGDKVYLSGIGGMTELNGVTATVAGVTSNTYQLSGINSSGYGAYTSGGTWSVVRAVYVDPLAHAIADGAAVDFGAAEGLVNGAHAKGDRILYVRDLDDVIDVAESAIIQTTLDFPRPLGGGNFNINFHADGLFAWNTSS